MESILRERLWKIEPYGKRYDKPVKTKWEWN